MQIKEVYGNSYTKLLKSISSSGKSMFIESKFQTFYGHLEFKSSIMYNNIISDCQTWLDMEKNILTSPNQSCSWLITANFRSHIILTFTFIEVSSHTSVPRLRTTSCIEGTYELRTCSTFHWGTVCDLFADFYSYTMYNYLIRQIMESWDYLLW